mgnify:CR=1 FL=1
MASIYETLLTKYFYKFMMSLNSTMVVQHLVLHSRSIHTADQQWVMTPAYKYMWNMHAATMYHDLDFHSLWSYLFDFRSQIVVLNIYFDVLANEYVEQRPAYTVLSILSRSHTINQSTSHANKRMTYRDLLI